MSDTVNITASLDDGAASSMRFADLMAKYDIPTTFYLPVEWHSLAYEKEYEPLSYKQAQELADHFEIGSHTITHRLLTRISYWDAEEEIVESQTMLENLFNTTVKKFCPPRGYTNDALTEIALSLYDSQRLTRGKNLLHIHPKSGANKERHWLEHYKFIHGDVEIWGHGQELDRYPDLWSELEDWLEDIHSK